MRRILSLCVIAFLIFGLCACSGGEVSSVEDKTLAEASIKPEISDKTAGTEASEEVTPDAGTSEGVDAESSEVNTVEAKKKKKKKKNKGQVLKYTTIDPASKSNTKLSWGFGGPRDEYNRPTPALTAQSNYGSLNADFIIPTHKKKIYLTFDEGYENGYTSQILDTLKAKKVKAVFFVTKPYAEANGDLVKRMIKEGHIVGNHSVHHPADGLPAHSLDYQTNEVKELHSYIKENFDYDMFLFRYPAGIYSEQSLAVVQNCGYRSVFWSFAHADWDPDKQPDPTSALKKLEDNLHPGAIYLLHAVSATNTQILGSFIDDARAEGYTLGFYTDTIPGVGN